MEPYLEVRNLKKYFKKVKAVDDISFSCGEGELLVILGPSGAGKTTTLKMIAGIVEPTDGEIYLKGELLNPIEPQKRNISMVFEEYALYPHLTVFENIASPLRIRKMSEEEIKKRVTMIAEMVGIHEHLHKYPSQVSGGQKQRTALARCLVREADLYLLDEPIAHLDAKLRHRMRGEFKRIHKELGKTMVYVTHDFREALALADRIIVLNKGKIEQIGTPEEVFEKPVNTFVATLLGEPAMNLVELDQSKIMNGTLEVKIREGEMVSIKGVSMREGSYGGTLLGFRHFKATLSPEETESSLPGEVYVYEIVEDKKIFTIRVGKSLVKVTTDREVSFEINERVFVNLDPKSLYLFDEETGKRIEPYQEGA